MNVSGLKKDKLLRRCESLMAKGINSITDLAEELGVSYNTAQSYQEIVKERWANSYTIEELQAKRKELIKQTEAIITESWQLKGKSKTVQDASNALRTALMAIERLQRLHGIDAVPPQPEKPESVRMFELADKLNTTLSPEAKQMVIDSIRRAIKLNKEKKSEIIS